MEELMRHGCRSIKKVGSGQCNQICGINHSSMPIAVKAVSEKEYENWLIEAKTKFASAPPKFRVASTIENKQ